MKSGVQESLKFPEDTQSICTLRVSGYVIFFFYVSLTQIETFFFWT